MDAIEVVAWATAAGLAVVALFQVALAAGAPWGDFAWSGRQPGRLPATLRVASAVSAPVLLGMAAVVLLRAGVWGEGDSTWVTVVAWVVAAMLTLSALGNLASRSPRERAVFGPLSLLIAIGAIVVAIAGPA
ncbi:hypothetical protein [Demequina pelophila]|uniref:hypothetical protein n=1 Tax=Demequina pelophila TaxID=1638984 RepID=UPI000ABE583C|nr:hypothetical protein [Demequina pelophila]